MNNHIIHSLDTERLILEPMSINFCTLEYVKWLNDKEVYQYLDTGGNYSLEGLSDYLAKYSEKPVFFWAIIVKETNAHIGNIKIDPINQRHQIGEYGILMGDKNNWGKGYAKEASTAVIKYCFKTVGLRKITLGVVKENIAAVKLYESLGFQTEGIYQMHGVYAGKFCDVLRMAIFNHENTLVQNHFKNCN